MNVLMIQHIIKYFKMELNKLWMNVNKININSNIIL